MKIVFLETLATPAECFRRGAVYDLPEKQAQEYVKANIGREVADKPAAPVTADKVSPVKVTKVESVKAEKKAEPKSEAKPAK